jgi:hypothetical protein
MNEDVRLVVSQFGLFLPGAQPIGEHVPAGHPGGAHKRLIAASPIDL